LQSFLPSFFVWSPTLSLSLSPSPWPLLIIGLITYLPTVGGCRYLPTGLIDSLVN
jgi:hypothetical protein